MLPAEEPIVVWKVSLPVSVAASVVHLLRDPISGRPIYGKRSELITSLLRGWLDGQKLQLEPLTAEELKKLAEASA